MPKRKDVIGGNPLEVCADEEQVLPGQSNPLGGHIKLFGYKLPENLGRAFKLYCHARDKTASEVMENILQDFLKGKQIYPD